MNRLWITVIIALFILLVYLIGLAYSPRLSHIETIGIEEYIKEAKTGDILLNHETMIWCKYMHLFTQSSWGHMALVIRKTPYTEPLVIDISVGCERITEAKTDTSITPLRTWLKMYKLGKARVGVAKWRGEDLNTKNIMKRYTELKDIPLFKSLRKVLSVFLWGPDTKTEMFCGEYVCELLAAETDIGGKTLACLPKFFVRSELWDTPIEVINI